MTSRPDYRELAQRISDGDAIDWDSIEGQLDGRRSALKLLDSIARVSAPRNPASSARRWGHLEIHEAIGAGSYGTVFRAFDPMLDRDVALKLAHGDKQRARSWVTEARRLSKVNHPNVVTVHGAEVHDGEAGIWFELLEGVTCSEWVDGNGPLQLPEFIAVADALCSALQSVHDAGLIHGDVKPDNVILTADGRPVLVDFGSATELDNANLISGSPGYLAPEVMEGKAPGPSSDLYALGLTLRFLLSGKRPDSGGAQFQPLPGAPAGLVTEIETACSPDASRRQPSAEHLRERLQRFRPRQRRPWMWVLPAAVALAGLAGWFLRPPVTVEGPVSVAVLPFVSAGNTEQDRFFADGVAEEVLNLLAGSDDLRVVARNSSFRFRAESSDTRQIGNALGAEFLVTGKVQRDGGELRVSAQLTEIRSGNRLWSEVFEATPDRIFEIQHNIAASLSRSLGVDEIKILSDRSRNLQAWQLYLEGMELWRRKGEGPVRAAIQLFEQSLEHDPNFAEAWAALGEAWIVLPRYSQVDLDQGIARGAEAARKALELDSSLAQPYLSLAALENRRGSLAEGLALLEQARARGPRHKGVLNTLSFDYGRAGWIRDATIHAELGVIVDPMEGGQYVTLGYLYLVSGEFERARETFLRAWNDLGLKAYFLWQGILAIHLLQGELDQAESWLVHRPGGGEHDYLKSVIAGLRDPAERARAVAELLRAADHNRLPLHELFDYLLLLDEPELAFERVMTGLDRGQYFLPNHIYMPMAKTLRDRPLILELADRLGLADLWRETGRLPDFCEEVRVHYDCAVLLGTAQ
ncbi:MAG: protein kinase [Xanthomonadales bacterium]|nr:protein kinase [Xanthomonadales bacterium]